jgi:hypothetical protein
MMYLLNPDSVLARTILELRARHVPDAAGRCVACEVAAPCPAACYAGAVAPSIAPDGSTAVHGTNP